jgi:hypothetical protein
MKPQLRFIIGFGLALVMLATETQPAPGDEPQQPLLFQLSKSDWAQAEKLADQLAALSPRVNREEAKLLARWTFATVSRLRREYHMFGTPIFNNFLIYLGLRKRGYCYQWCEDLLVALDALRLKTLELHWGEHDPGTWRENNCLVVTARGQPFSRGIMLECWRHLGHLYFGPVVSDWETYKENGAYARLVREKAARSNGPASDYRVAFQRSIPVNRKSND